MNTADHECVFVEEQEPSGRLILPPCIVCGLTAMDALDQMGRELTPEGADSGAGKGEGRTPSCRPAPAHLHYTVDTQEKADELRAWLNSAHPPAIQCMNCGADVLAQGYACCPNQPEGT